MNDEIIYENIFDAIKALEPGHVILNASSNEGFPIKHNGQRMHFKMPNGTFTSIRAQDRKAFYRGENAVYDSCKASLFRINNDDKRLLELLKTCHFISFLGNQPEVINHSMLNMYVDLWMIAQHYEFKTPVMDLTDEIAVAAFFATHDYDLVAKSYVVKKSGLGVIRHCDLSLVNSGNIIPVGIQPYSRPSQQDGFALYLNEDQDFAKLSNKIVFKQDYECNIKLNRALFGGIDYFPQEQISVKAKMIQQGGIITKDTINVLLRNLSKGNHLLQHDVNEQEIIEFTKRNYIHIADVDIIPQYTHRFNPWAAKIRTLVLNKSYKC